MSTESHINVTLDDQPVERLVRVDRSDVLIHFVERGDRIGAFTATGANAERLRVALTERVLFELRESLGQTLRTRLGSMIRIDPNAQCREHGCARSRCDASHTVPTFSVERRFEFNLNARDVASIVDELARNSTQALLGLLDCLEPEA